MKKLRTYLLASLAFVVGAFAVAAAGCAIESDGKLSGRVENPFPWANAAPETQPAK